MLKHLFFTAILFMLVNLSFFKHAHAADGKLIATAGLMQLEGAGGGGIVPWATLAGHDSREEISINAMMTRVELDDYRLSAIGASISLFDRAEIAVARHSFDVEALGIRIDQDIYSAKYRLFGDVVYGDWPQISLGWQHKRLKDGDIAEALGAANSRSGNDVYLAATKVHLGAVAGYNAVWNLSLRASKANQIGLLGFGSQEQNDYAVLVEASVGILLSRHLVIGAEYRQKPDNLGLGEQDWKDVFISYIPSKSVNFTLAWAELGSIAGAPNQNGLYLSISGSLL